MTRYNTPREGASDWHVPLNENFERLERDVERRDAESNRGKYEPTVDALFRATDTGNVYVGDGTSWTRLNPPSSPRAAEIWRDDDVYRSSLGGVESESPGKVVQSAIDRLSNRGGGRVLVSGHEHFLERPITVKEGVELSTGPNAVLFHWMPDRPDTPAVHFEPKTGTARLVVDAQQRKGVVFGEDGAACHNYGGLVEVAAAGERTAVELRGYYHRYGHINAWKGSEGIHLDGACDVFVNSAICVNQTVGFKAENAHAAYVTNLDCDSPKSVGVQLDGCHDVNVDGSVWYNASAYEGSGWIGAVLGRWAPNRLCDVALNVNRSGGQGAYLGDNEACSFEFHVTNGRYRGVESPALHTGIEITDDTVESVLSGFVTSDVPTPVTGTEADTLRVDLHLP